MTQPGGQPLAKGQNAPLSTASVVVSAELTAPADVSVLLVTAAGKVRSDADFIFFNQPNGPGVQLQTGAAPSIRVTFAGVPADIEQIRAVITLDGAGATFGRFPAPTARVSDAVSGAVLYSYRIEGLSSESVVIALELYRRQGAWKVRAVGQGYAGGFADLVRDHGVSVDDAPAPPAPPVAAPPAPTYTPPAPTYAAPPPAPTYAPPAPAPTYAPPAPTYSPTAATTPFTPPPAQQPPAPTYTPASAYQQPPQPPQPQPQPQGELSLSKARPLSLAKGQRVTLKKEGGVALTQVRMGLGWDPVKKGGFFGSREVDIDLDASVVMFADHQPVDVVYYGQLTAKDGSVRHQGDNLTGEGAGDDEVVLVDLTRVPVHVTTLLFLVTSYRGHTFENVANAFCRLVDMTSNAELARFTLQGGMPFTAMLMSKFYREGDSWRMQAIGEGFQAKHPGEAIPQLGRFLGK